MAQDSRLPEKYYPPVLDEEGLDEAELFDRAMAEVRPLGGKRVRPGPGRNRRLPEADVVLPRDLLQRYLRENRFSLVDDPEYQEGGPDNWNQVLLSRLRQGGFSVRAELDLHGLSRREARTELERFLLRCSREGITCVRIIHGKGNRSRRQFSILKREIPKWLMTRKMSRRVVAYASAREVDGGVGATYVLLRKTGG